ncbi:YcgL domain-containing protein [Serratia plymuthica 4Rx13]|nr:YcgL domain-containing protein [Serratia plymuthica 4Rx13]
MPEDLMKSFGSPQLAMVISLEGREKLASADIEKVKEALKEEGFYLQFPPPVENLLNQHLSEDKK